jgi:hypothetical protein
VIIFLLRLVHGKDNLFLEIFKLSQHSYLVQASALSQLTFELLVAFRKYLDILRHLYLKAIKLKWIRNLK